MMKYYKRTLAMIFMVWCLFVFSSCHKDRSVISIEVNYEKSMLEGFLNEYQFSDILINVFYNDDTCEEVIVTFDMIDNTTLQIGVNLLKINYQGFSTSVEVNIKNKHEGSMGLGFQKVDLYGQTTYKVINYHGTDKAVIIPDTYQNYLVTEIADEVFRDNQTIETLYIGSNITKIGHAVTLGCSNLKSVSIPKNVKEIGEYAFISSRIIYLEHSEEQATFSPNWSNPLTTGIYYNFDINKIYRTNQFEYHIINNDSLYYEITNYIGNEEHIIIPSSFDPNNITKVKSIGKFAFAYNSTIKSVKMDQTEVTIIGESCFVECGNLEEVLLSKLCIELGNNVFVNCYNLCNIDLGTSLKNIGSKAFTQCNSLINIILPISLEEIGNFAFQWCVNLGEIVIPTNVTMIGEGAFYSCSKLKIYCRVAQLPSTWHNSWNNSNRPVQWSFEG